MKQPDVRIKQSSKGFTLVELLITIVVIAVLAAVSVVAYNGIQHRANMVRIKSGAESYAKALDLYRVDHGHYPDSPTGGNFFCLGHESDYPATSVFAAGQCYISGFSGFSYNYESSPNTDLAPYVSSLPSLAGPTIEASDGSKYRGVFIDYGHNSNGSWMQIAFALPSGESCEPFNEWWTDESMTYCGQIIRDRPE